MTIDASPVEGILEQKLEHSDVYEVVGYAIWSLTEVGGSHSQKGCKSFAVVWGCKRFCLFLLGVKFELFTDHEALLKIMKHYLKFILVYQSLLQGSKDGF